MKKLVEAACKHDILLIYSNDAHFSQGVEVVKKWGKHAIKGTKGAKIISELKSSSKDSILEKKNL